MDNKPDKPITLRLTLIVTYNPNGTPSRELYDMLHAIATDAANNGTMTGDTPAEVEAWSHGVERID